VNVKFSIYFHNYYGNDQQWLSYFSSQFSGAYNLFYNCVSGSYSRLSQAANFSNGLNGYSIDKAINLVVKQSLNKGKDIGGKLILMDAYLKLGIKSDYILLLHDKHSPYHNQNEQWQKELFRIAQKEYRQTILDLFEKDSQVGIVAAQKAIRNEADNDQNRDAYIDTEFIQTLKKDYSINPPGLQYVAGTMFWVRASIFEDFFSMYSPLSIQAQLEEGNVLDDEPTITHAWERLLSWLVTSKGYKIKGI
jgi:lipopolysaccharide biosynthesis protein